MKTLLTAALILAMPIMAWSAETASPTLDISFPYEVEGIGDLVGFVAQYNGVDRCFTKDPVAREIRCTAEIQNEPVEITVVPIYTWSRRGLPVGRTTWTPLQEMFDAPPISIEGDLTITPIPE